MEKDNQSNKKRSRSEDPKKGLKYTKTEYENNKDSNLNNINLISDEPLFSL